MRHSPVVAVVGAAALFALATTSAAAQQTMTHESMRGMTQDSSSVRFTLGAMATAALTRASPAYIGHTLTELQLVQPNVMGAVQWRSFAFAGTLNGEGYTLRRGELNAGIFGEGYVDRRHPHTLVHEAMLVWRSGFDANADVTSPVSFSLAAGKGFVPFGSDDPMMRPLEKYPVNHHHSQIIERVQTVAAVRVGGASRFVALEGAAFNGDEPAGPFHGPKWSRVGDSWSARLTAQPLPGIELSASRAMVTSPEIQQGGAFNHAQHHVAARFDRSTARGARYLLAEWARTDEINNKRTAFRYQSALAEGAYGWHGAQVAARVERTDRAEQARFRDVFREPLGHIDFQILGVTQWNVATVGVEGPAWRARFMHAAPFVEVARSVPSARHEPSVFEPQAFYGASPLWSYTVGLRLHAGSMPARMGRYGVLAEKTDAHSHTH